MDVKSPLLNLLMVSNEQQVQNAFDVISGYGKRKVALLGLSFKSGTDDLRDRLRDRRLIVGRGRERGVRRAEIDTEDAGHADSSTSAGAITVRSTPSASDGSLVSTARQP